MSRYDTIVKSNRLLFLFDTLKAFVKTKKNYFIFKSLNFRLSFFHIFIFTLSFFCLDSLAQIDIRKSSGFSFTISSPLSS